MTELSPFWKVTSSGTAFDFANPTPVMIDIETIAHELALTCRWGGNTEMHYSVAQHSVLVADAIREPSWRIYGLLHDAAEAYIGDVPTPLKAYVATLGADIHGLERRILGCVWQRFGLDAPSKQAAEAVDIADARMLATEYRDVVKGHVSNWTPRAAPINTPIRPMAWPDAEDMFLNRFRGYMELASQ